MTPPAQIFTPRAPLFRPGYTPLPRLRRVLENGQPRVTEDGDSRVSERNTVLTPDNG